MTIKTDTISSKNSPLNLQKLAVQLHQHCIDTQTIITTAESCTGGLVSSHITEIAGSSAMFDRAFITYSNAAKIDMLNVSKDNLTIYGAVSEMIALEMLLGALKNSAANLGISITGIAGPGGGSDEKPVGTVCFAWGNKTTQYQSTEHFKGNRHTVRLKAVKFAFEQLLLFISKTSK